MKSDKIQTPAAAARVLGERYTVLYNPISLSLIRY